MSSVWRRSACPGSRAHHEGTRAPTPQGRGYTSPMNSRASDEIARVAVGRTRRRASKALALAREVLAIEAGAIAALSTRLGNAFVDAVELILPCRGRVVVCGIGKSGHVGAQARGNARLDRHAGLLRASDRSDARRSWHDHAGRRRRHAVQFRRNRRARRAAAARQARGRADHRAHRQRAELARAGGRPPSRRRGRHAKRVRWASRRRPARPRRSPSATRSRWRCSMRADSRRTISCARTRAATLGRTLLSGRRRDAHRRAHCRSSPTSATLAEAIVEMSRKGMGMTVVVRRRPAASPASSPTATCAAACRACATSQACASPT